MSKYKNWPEGKKLPKSEYKVYLNEWVIQKEFSFLIEDYTKEMLDELAEILKIDPTGVRLYWTDGMFYNLMTHEIEDEEYD